MPRISSPRRPTQKSITHHLTLPAHQATQKNITQPRAHPSFPVNVNMNMNVGPIVTAARKAAATNDATMSTPLRSSNEPGSTAERTSAKNVTTERANTSTSAATTPLTAASTIAIATAKTATNATAAATVTTTNAAAMAELVDPPVHRASARGDLDRTAS